MHSISKRLKSVTVTEAYIQLKLLTSLVYSFSWQCSHFATKKQTDGAIHGNGTLLRPVRNNSCRVSDRQAGLSSFLGPM